MGSAANGREALDAVERFHPRLVVLDVVLPDGFEVQRRLAQAGVRVPVLFLTARNAFAACRDLLAAAGGATGGPAAP